jgi:hypothetical protein
MMGTVELKKELREATLSPETTHVFKVKRANGRVYSGTVEYYPDHGSFKWEALVDHRTYKTSYMNFMSHSFEDLMHRIEGVNGYKFTGLEIVQIKKVDL